MRIIKLSLIFLVVLALTSTALHGQTTVDLFPSQDNSIFEESGDESLGKSGFLFAGRTAGLNNSKSRRALIKFDISAIPSNAVISVAQLELIINKAPNNSSHLMKIHRVLADWGEGDSGAGVSGGAGVQASDNDVTWSHRFYNMGELWQNAGGDFVTLPSAVSSVRLDPNEFFPKGVWNSSGLVSDVQDWVDSNVENYGWIIVGDESQDFSAKKFVSREEDNIFIDIRPKLSVTYTIPGQEIVKSPILNEVNLHDQWIEIYNGTDEVFDLSSWSLCEEASCTTINSAEAPIIHGDAMLDPDEFIIIRWDSLNTNSGEVMLQSSVGALDTAMMKDYLQYGGPSQTNATAAVIKGFWDDISSTLSIPPTYKSTLSIISNTDFINGQLTQSTDWNIWGATASVSNNEFPSMMSLNNQVIGASYIATDEISVNGRVFESQSVELSAPNGINLNSGMSVDSSAIMQATIPE